MEDTPIFDGKSLSDVFKDVYSLSASRRKTLLDTITHIRSFMTNADSVVVLAPILATYMDVMIRNDEHLVKIATIVQRITSAQSYKSGASGPESLLTDADKAQLLAEITTELDQFEKKIAALPPGEAV